MKPLLSAAGLAALALLAGCAPTAAKLLRDPAAQKCFIADSTANVAGSVYEAMFRRAGSGTPSFPPCDSVPAAAVRIRPIESVVPSKGSSYLPLAIDVTTAATGLGLMAALGNSLPLLIAGIQATPTARSTYRMERVDSARISRELIVDEPAWFKEREEARRDLMDRSAREISRALFGTRHPLEERRWGRASVEPVALVLNATEGDLALGVHLEKFLPRNFTLHAGARAARYALFDESHYSLQGGLRRYFFGDHARLFLGIEPLLAYENLYFLPPFEQLRVITLAGLATFGYTWQGDLFYTELSFGAGPGRSWVQANDAGIRGTFGSMGVGSLAVGFMF